MILPRTLPFVSLLCAAALSVQAPYAFAADAAAPAAPTCPADHIVQGAQPPAGREWKCTTKDGIVDGLWLTWYDDKQLLSERHMKLGKEHGRQRMWWPNGQLMMEGVSVDGHRYQGYKYWTADGTPTQLEIQTETVTQPLDLKR